MLSGLFALPLGTKDTCLNHARSITIMYVSGADLRPGMFFSLNLLRESG
jgi:hypothetical protein